LNVSPYAAQVLNKIFTTSLGYEK